jgi:hypothetical protein
MMTSELPRAEDEIGVAPLEGASTRGISSGCWLPSPSRKTTAAVASPSAATPAQHAEP